MNEPSERLPFDWKVRVDRWRPTVRPKPPYGPIAVEVVRSCPLRRVFELTPGYERRSSFMGRIGLAYHRTIESFLKDPLHGNTLAEMMNSASDRFEALVADQCRRAEARPRERGLPKHEDRIRLAREAVLAEAVRISASRPGEDVEKDHRGDYRVELEVNVQSADAMFRGRVDRAEHRSDGVHLVDYKSAVRADLTERYEHQLQLYALMWADRRKDWPVAATLHYPLVGKSLDVPVERQSCEHVAREARDLIEKVSSISHVDALATPGDVCQVCEFRPWCQPFWNWQNRERSNSTAYRLAPQGVEAKILGNESTPSRTALSVTWRGITARVVGPSQRFPHLQQVMPGDIVRCLDFNVHGVVTQPKLAANECAEVFVVE